MMKSGENGSYNLPLRVQFKTAFESCNIVSQSLKLKERVTNRQFSYAECSFS